MRKGIIYNIIAIVGVSALFTSCFVAKDYTRPELSNTDNLFRTDQLPQDSISAATVSYRELFEDPYLIEYIEEGLINNIDIRIALQQIIAAEAYVKQGKAGYLPTLGANATITHQELSKNSQFGSFLSNTSTDQFELNANLSWEADIWGKIRSNSRASQANYLQTVAAHQAVKTELISRIASTYYQLLALDAQLEVTNASIETRDNSVVTIKALKDAGQVTQVAVDQNVALLNNAKALVIDLEIAIFRTENALSILLGKEPQNFERGTIENLNTTSDIAIGVPFTLLRNRPDVMAAEYALIESFELTNVAKSMYYPSLTLTATAGFQSLDLADLIDTNSLFANIIGGLTQPIFNKRAIRTQNEVAIAQQEQALLNFKQSLLVAGQEVSNALYGYTAETEKYQFRLNEIEALRNAETNSEELLNNGFATYLDLLTARQSALSAELNVVNSKLQQQLYIVDLYEALGGGWQ
jgi:NodT family efflux transporter outer membrane factor (OMF) lipoprotein